jgi:hypothetical protein
MIVAIETFMILVALMIWTMITLCVIDVVRHAD